MEANKTLFAFWISWFPNSFWPVSARFDKEIEISSISSTYLCHEGSSQVPHMPPPEAQVGELTCVIRHQRSHMGSGCSQQRCSSPRSPCRSYTYSCPNCRRRFHLPPHLIAGHPSRRCQAWGKTGSSSSAAGGLRSSLKVLPGCTRVKTRQLLRMQAARYSRWMGVMSLPLFEGGHLRCTPGAPQLQPGAHPWGWALSKVDCVGTASTGTGWAEDIRANRAVFGLQW